MEQLIKDIEQYLNVTQPDDWYIKKKLNLIKKELNDITRN